MHLWLLDETVARQMRAAIASGAVPSAAQQAEYEASIYDGDMGRETPRILSVAGDRARISVQGILTDRPSLMARWFGGGNATYPEIVEAIQAANNDDRVARIDLAIDSVGGTASSGWLAAMEAVRDSEKPVDAYVENVATSAAYGLATQAERIQTRNRMSYVGSVGVVVTVVVWDDEVTITSSDAPEKRPDVKTEEGRAMVQKHLDEIHAVFADMVATGRGTTVETVNANYGRGATLLASEALERGMIDAIGDEQPQTQPTAAGGNQPEAHIMDLDKLKAEHPAVYQAAVKIGEEKGVAAERERVESFLIAGEQSGDMKLAQESIKSGAQMSGKLLTQFTMAAANRKDLGERAAEDDEVAPGAEGARRESGENNEHALDQVTNLVASQIGYTAEA